VLTDSPSDSLIHGVGGTDTQQFKWWYMAFWDNKGLVDCSVAMLTDPALPTNKMVGCLWPNDVEGNDRRNFYPPPMKAAGLTVVDGGNFSVGLEDWTTIIALFKKQGCEMLTGLMIPPDWANFWKQCYQQSWVPKVADIGIQTLFPTTQEALGTTGFGLCGTSWWHPTNPFKSSLTGESCADLCLDYEKRTGQQWTQPQEHYMLFEWAVDALKRTNNVDDKEEIIKNVASTKMDTIVGPLDLTSAVDSGGVTVGQRCYPNVCFTPLWMGQWVKGDKQNPWSTKVWEYDLLIVENTCAPMLTDQAKPIVLPGTTFK
jgi:branched-chain amino acid transport system substrate-binding protein